MLSYDFSDILTVIPPSHFFLLSIIEVSPFLTSNHLYPDSRLSVAPFFIPFYFPSLISAVTPGKKKKEFAKYK